MDKYDRDINFILGVGHNKITHIIIMTIIFVILNLTHSIELHWVWVFSPIWIGLAVSIICIIFALILDIKSHKGE